MQHNIHRDLQFSIRILAERAIWDVRESKRDFQVFTLSEMLAKLTHKLIERAEVCYNENPNFRNTVRQNKNDVGRIRLLQYMHTWTLDLLKRKPQTV